MRERSRDRRRRTRLVQQSIVVVDEKVDQPADFRRDDGHPAGHRFDGRETKRLEVRGLREQIGGSEQMRRLRCGSLKAHPVFESMLGDVSARFASGVPRVRRHVGPDEHEQRVATVDHPPRLQQVQHAIV